jgi:putative transcriptional regulator
VRWNLRMCAAERGVWKATHMRALLAEAGLEISSGKMSQLWTGEPVTIRLTDLEVICRVLDARPSDLLVLEAAPTAQPTLRVVPAPSANRPAPGQGAVGRTAPPL